MTSKSSSDLAKCCFCINLKTGCFLVGYFHLIEIIVASIVVGIRNGKTIAAIQSSETLHKFTTILIANTGVILTIYAVALAFSIVLLIGLHKNKPGYVKGYLIFKIMYIVFYVGLLLASSIGGHENIEDLLFKIILLSVGIYFLLVLKNYHTKMREDSNVKV